MNSAMGVQPDIKKILARNLEYFLKESKKSRREVCFDLNIKYTTFCEWIRGNSAPKLETLDVMSRYFGIEIGDFFVNIEPGTESAERGLLYAKTMCALDPRILEYLTDEQVRELLHRGFSFRHKTLEERVLDSGEPLRASEEVDWGIRMGAELW
ncbi:MAG: helix-turn-helix transcriptional regulator [Lachnospiraceae bacterium]|nr:helix-turn-helix transcriptional regulator [Lachnospiraceae bacterium]